MDGYWKYIDGGEGVVSSTVDTPQRAGPFKQSNKTEEI